MNKMIFIKSFQTGFLYDRFKLIYVYLSEGDKVSKCYSCLKMTIKAHLHITFFSLNFIKRASH